MGCLTAALLVLGLPGAEQAGKPKLSAVSLYEQRNRFVERKGSIGGYERLAVTLRLEGLGEVRSYGNVKVAEAKTDAGTDLIRRPKDRGAFFGVTDVPTFQSVAEWQRNSGKLDLEVILHRTPRGAKTVRLKGTLDVLLGGEPAQVDFPSFRGKEGEAFEDKALAAAGLKVVAIRPGAGETDRQVRYGVEGDSSVLLGMSLLDARGAKIQANGGYHPNKRGGGSYMLYGRQAFPKDARLRVTFVKGAKRTTLPFEYELGLP
jgi:hypothetical protein